MPRRIALALTLLTGFSGLVYEVAWQKYLASLLGSQSEATAAVLGLFLGGLSLGYALFGHWSERWAREGGSARLLGAYGVAESSIGVLALVFPWLVSAVTRVSVALPIMSPGPAFAIDVLLCALLIGPASVLMGGTVPLLTQALSRNVDDATRLHARVYALNTAGAFAGALAAGFFVLPWLGLAGSVRAMGLLNLAAGGVFVVLGLRRRSTSHVPEASPRPRPEAITRLRGQQMGLAASAALAGFATMTLQVTMNRLGGLALGASQYTFAMVVATFVLCIALGSAVVARLRHIGTGTVVLSQWLLVVYLLLLYPSVENAPYYAHVIRAVFASHDASFYPYHLAVFFALLSASLIPIGLSGALLPMLFHVLRRGSQNLGAVAGELYGWNTLGSLLGALIGGYALFFWLDLHHAYRLAVGALAVAATVLSLTLLPRRRVAGLAGLAAVAIALISQPAWQPHKLALGTFRHHAALPQSFAGAEAFFAARVRQLSNPDFVLFYDDDPSTSMAVLDIGLAGGAPERAIVTNGKSDGAVPGDDVTTGLLALLPVIFSERAERAFVIGYGTGMTVGELASLDSVQEVVVAEISRGVVAAAPHFASFVRPAAYGPKTKLINGDAYRVLLRSPGRYDVIVSEPSNPWVAGVEMVYSEEFLSAARERLRPGGVYAQWFHTYETDAASIAILLNTFRRVFDRVGVWRGRGIDLVLIGFEEPDAVRDLAFVEQRFDRPDVRSQLADLGIGTLGALLAHEVLPLGVTREAKLDGPVHTLSHPRLAHVAARAFFVGAAGVPPSTLGSGTAARGAANSLVRRYASRYGGMLPGPLRADVVNETCVLAAHACATLIAEWRVEEPGSALLTRALHTARRDPQNATALAEKNLAGLERLFDPTRLSDRQHDLGSALRAERIFERYYHHAAPFDARALDSIWSRCAGEPGCREGVLRSAGIGVVRHGAGQHTARAPRRAARP